MSARLTTQERTLREISEADHCKAIEDALDLFGWRWSHWRTAWSRGRFQTPVTGHPGFPDYVCVRPPELLFIEAKRELGKVEPHQQEWIDALNGVGECIVSRPSGLEELLERLR